jgi:murein DD-endopeptidase MepM/ murein hydrolase activator NlpD
VTLALAGCSSTRLDSSPSFALNDPPSARSSPMLRPQASLSRSSVGAGSGPGDASRSDGNGRSDTDYARSDYRSDYTPPRPNSDSDVRVAALPPATGAAAPYGSPSNGSPTYGGPAEAPPRDRDRPPVATPSTAAGSGETIVVQPGDSLFGLSKRHNVSVEALTSANGLSSASLQPGQTLRLPAKTTARKPLQRTERPEAIAAESPAIGSSRAQQPLPPVSAEAAAKYTGSYTVQKGDSIYGLAMRMKVPMAELQQVNGIADVHKVKPGTVLKVPGTAVAEAAPAAGKLPPAVAQRESAAATPTAGGTGPRPVLLNPERSAAAAPPTGPQPVTSDALPPSVDAKSPSKATNGATNSTDVAAAGTATAGLAPDVKLRWPAKGKVIGNYGPRADGTHNDGINISVPQGTDVHSAEAGVVAYAGSELKGYGNLVLVRHENGWITAYAHNSELIAKRGDRVKRGQVIAKAGMTGSVDKPQVHFELRQGSKPVDPMPFMDRP